MVDFRWKLCCSVGNCVVEVIEVPLHSASEERFVRLGIRYGAASIDELDATSSFVKPGDREERDV